MTIFQQKKGLNYNTFFLKTRLKTLKLYQLKGLTVHLYVAFFHLFLFYHLREKLMKKSCYTKLCILNILILFRIYYGVFFVAYIGATHLCIIFLTLSATIWKCFATREFLKNLRAKNAENTVFFCLMRSTENMPACQVQPRFQTVVKIFQKELKLLQDSKNTLRVWLL